MNTIIKSVCADRMCIGCGACVDLCPKAAIHIEDHIAYMNSIIDESKCVNCSSCYNVCPMNSTPPLSSPIDWVEGWDLKAEEREMSSSGGAITAIARSFITNHGAVIGCGFKDGEFGFEIIEQVSDLYRIKGSKYVKSNSVGVFKRTIQLLKNKEVLFIGLPCQVSALKKAVQNSRWNDRLYTIDLICHGTPSPILLKGFLSQYKIDLASLKSIDFRKGNSYYLSCNGEKLVEDGIRDRYTAAFLNGVSFTEGCYHCKYATEERCSDITAGDSWGSSLPLEERNRGVSLLLIQSNRGKMLANESGLFLQCADPVKAKKANRQLNGPSKVNAKRNKFFTLYSNGRSFNSAYFFCFPIHSIKQEIKKIAIALRK